MAPPRSGGVPAFESQKNKVHRGWCILYFSFGCLVHKKGGKAKRENETKKVRGNNAKAFAFRSAVAAGKAIRRFFFYFLLAYVFKGSRYK